MSLFSSETLSGVYAGIILLFPRLVAIAAIAGSPYASCFFPRDFWGKHPEWYPNLTVDSPLIDLQKFMYERFPGGPEEGRSFLEDLQRNEGLLWSFVISMSMAQKRLPKTAYCWKFFFFKKLRCCLVVSTTFWAKAWTVWSSGRCPIPCGVPLPPKWCFWPRAGKLTPPSTEGGHLTIKAESGRSVRLLDVFPFGWFLKVFWDDVRWFWLFARCVLPVFLES